MEILERPILSKKIAELADKRIYGFIVNPKSNKIEIKKEIENTYAVQVEQIRTMRYLGKKKVKYTKSRILTGKKKDYKKAIVQLKEGDLINFYEN